MIEQAACAYAKKVDGIMHKATARRDFMEGARFVAEQNRWISVDEKLPPIGEKVIAKKEGCWLTLAMYCCLDEQTKGKPQFAWVAGNSVRNWDVTHWRKLA